MILIFHFSFSQNIEYSSLCYTLSILYTVALVVKLCPTLATPWIVAHQTPLSMEFSRQAYWSGLPFPSPGDLSNPTIELRSPALQGVSCIAGRFFTYWATREAHSVYNSLLLLIPNSQCISSLTPPPWQPQVSSLPLWVCFIHKFTCVIFYIPHISDIVQYLSFSFWLISLSMIMLLQWHYFTSSLSAHLSMEI